MFFLLRIIMLRRNIVYLANLEHYTSEIAENAMAQYNASQYKFFSNNKLKRSSDRI